MNFIVLEEDKEFGLKLEYDRLCSSIVFWMVSDGVRSGVSYDSMGQARKHYDSMQERLLAERQQRVQTKLASTAP
jgi:hypothetical protein